MKHYAKITENNGGGLSLYIMDASDACIYAHSGYEYNHKPGQLVEDINTLIASDDVSDWEGNEPEIAAEWGSVDLDDPAGVQLVAEVADGILSTYPRKMGAAAMREFAVTAP